MLMLLLSNNFAQAAQYDIIKISQIDTGDFSGYVYVEGTIAAVADLNSKSVAIVDISHHNELKIHSTIFEGWPHDIVINQNTLFVSGFDNAELIIVDIEEPGNPKKLGVYRAGGETTDVAVYKDFAYLASQDKGLEIINITNRANPTIVGQLNLDRIAISVVVVNNTVYMADEGISVIDVETKSNPILLGEYYNNGLIRDLVVQYNYVYAADWNNGLIIIDVNDPSNPVLISQTYLGGNGSSVFIEDDLIYMAQWENGIDIYDVSDIKKPNLIANYNNEGTAVDVFKYGETIYVAAKEDGLELFEMQSQDSTQSTIEKTWLITIILGIAIFGLIIYRKKRVE